MTEPPRDAESSTANLPVRFTQSAPAAAAPSGVGASLSLVVEVAGSLGTLAGFVYVVGIATFWLRAKLVGLPAEIAIEHEARSTVIAFGLKAIFIVAAYFAALAVGGVVLLGLAVWVRDDRLPGPQRLWRCARCTATWLTPRGFWIALVDLALLIGAAWLSWRALALATGAVALFGAAVRWIDPTKPGTLKLIGTLGFLLGAAATGLGWQISASIPVQAVRVTPALPGIAGPVPYFGETDQVIYLGGVTVAPAASGQPRRYVYTHEIIEVGRADHRLAFDPKPYRFCRVDSAPASVLFTLIAGSGNVAPKSAVRPVAKAQARSC